MSDRSLVDEWLVIAEDDLGSAQFLYDKKHPRPLEIICYLCQQSAEKSLKAYLCANGIDAPKTHELELLCHRCNEIDPAFAEFFDACEELEVYATGTRYPNRVEVDEQDAERALKQAAAIYETVFGKIEQIFNDEELEPGGMTMQ